MVNENGETSKSCLCPSNEDFLKYVSNKYALYATTEADFICYDDDVRTQYHGIAQNGCFCQKCIDEFNKKHSTIFTRELLALALQDNDNGRMIVMLLNLSLDETGDFELEIRNGGTFYQLDKSGNLLPSRQKSTGNNTTVSINNIERMDYIIFTNI